MFYDEFACRGRVARCREGASLGRPRWFDPRFQIDHVVSGLLDGSSQPEAGQGVAATKTRDRCLRHPKARGEFVLPNFIVLQVCAKRCHVPKYTGRVYTGQE